MLLCLGNKPINKAPALSPLFLSEGGQCASPGPIVRPEEGEHRDTLPLSHTHHLCREQPGDTQGNMGELQDWTSLRTTQALKSNGWNARWG